MENNLLSEENNIVVIPDDEQHEEPEAVGSAANKKKPRLSGPRNVQIWANENQATFNQSQVLNESNGQSDAQSSGQSRSNRGRNSGGGWVHGENRFRNRGGNHKNGHSQRNEEYFIYQRLRQISGPTSELESSKEVGEFKFSGRNRLYVGNLTSEMSNEKYMHEMFKPYGELGDVFMNTDKNFAFVKLDYHVNAEKAQRALDGSTHQGRQLRVRFAPNQTVVRVSNLSPFVSNELLQKSFEIFGVVERAIIKVDDRGNSMGEGVIEFATKAAVNHCLRLCHDNCFFLTASLRPCIVELKEITDETGWPERTIIKSQQYYHERGVGPRFADLDSFEHEYGCKWKQLHAAYKTKLNELERCLKLEEEKLDAMMNYARNEREAELLRQELRQREADNERIKLELEVQYKEINLMDSADMLRRQNQMRDTMMRPETPIRSHNQEHEMQRMYSSRSSNGFGSMCDYNARSASSNSSPFVVFRDDKENYPTNQDCNIPIRDGPDAPDIADCNNLNRDFDIDGNNDLWGRRSL